MTSSSPAVDASLARPSPSPAQDRLITVRASGTTRGVTTNVVRPDSERVSSTRPNAVSHPQLKRADLEFAAQVRTERSR